MDSLLATLGLPNSKFAPDCKFFYEGQPVSLSCINCDGCPRKIETHEKLRTTRKGLDFHLACASQCLIQCSKDCIDAECDVNKALVNMRDGDGTDLHSEELQEAFLKKTRAQQAFDDLMESRDITYHERFQEYMDMKKAENGPPTGGDEVR
tara:strand:+ start:489 stop:941 length:453 start_codon:yes stop_codon:yes gene_type:complete